MSDATTICGKRNGADSRACILPAGHPKFHSSAPLESGAGLHWWDDATPGEPSGNPGELTARERWRAIPEARRNHVALVMQARADDLERFGYKTLPDDLRAAIAVLTEAAK